MMSTSTLTAPATVGLTTADPGAVHASILKGFPSSALKKFEKQSHIPLAEIARIVGIKARTLVRRKQGQHLKPDESDRLYRLAVVFTRAVELFEGDTTTAREWLTRPVRALGEKVPLELARTEVGSRMVLDVIGRLEHGVFT
jgi:putative toxin-antitoxin system antitoxin component (TIGR02293 family)